MAKQPSGFVRITGGNLKGRKIRTPGGATHPMGERERIALFNMIVEYLPGNFVLDAFAGSGALGIEALSRGAALVLFMDKDAHVCDVINENLRELGLYGVGGGALKSNVYHALATATDRFGIVLADPPYDKYNERKIKVLARVVADPGGILVLSHPGEAPELPDLKLVKSHKYAGANLSLYVHQNAVDD